MVKVKGPRRTLGKWAQNRDYSGDSCFRKECSGSLAYALSRGMSEGQPISFLSQQ